MFDYYPPTGITEELFAAYFECRKNKRNTINALLFEKHFERNLFLLEEEIKSCHYTPGRSIAFIVNNPLKREIFAADFRDRVVHHWLIAKLNPLFERIFINDSYACRTGKGTHFGIKQVDSFIKACSDNYKTDCYILKLDIAGFFMHINRAILFKSLHRFILKYYQAEDKTLVLEICEKLVFNNPAENCIIKGRKSDWVGLPKNKSLFHSPPDCGLPIGNLTSQVFANFYLNPFDHFIKTTLGIRYYGRYVDDFVIVHQNKEYLKSLIPKIRDYLHDELQLELHPNKIYLQHFSKGVKFLGVIIKPHRIYIASRTKGNFYQAIQKQNKIARDHKPTKKEQAAFLSIINSYLGILNPCKSSREHAPLSLWRGAGGEAKMQDKTFKIKYQPEQNESKTDITPSPALPQPGEGSGSSREQKKNQSEALRSNKHLQPPCECAPLSIWRGAGGEAKMHYKTYKLRKRMIRKHISGWWENYFFAKGYVKMVAKQKIRKRKHFRKIG
jgi:RNA-directed DNA polymerase